MASRSSKTLVEIEERTELGSGASGRIRAGGKVPANVYGMGLPPYSITVDNKRIREVLQLESGRNTVVNLVSADGAQSRDVMIRDLQRDPVTGGLLHVDFIRVDPDKPLQIAVPVHLQGIPDGVKNQGGVVDFMHREVNVSCLMADIPESFSLDISELMVGQNVSVNDLELGERLELLDDPQTIIAVIAAARAEEVAPTVEEEEEAAAAAEGEEAAAPEGEEQEPTEKQE